MGLWNLKPKQYQVQLPFAARSIFSNKIPASKFITIAFQKLGKRVFYFFYSIAVTLQIISTAGNDITGVCYILLFSLLLLFIFVVALLREAILRRFLCLKHSTFEPFFFFHSEGQFIKTLQEQFTSVAIGLEGENNFYT